MPKGTVVELDIPIWPTGIAFEKSESMQLHINGHDHELHEWPNLAAELTNLNEGSHAVHTGEKYPSFILLPLVF